jgi:serine phosphatase RsbU (regulator of sigma subunit)
MLTYWYENYDKLDVDYDNVYSRDSETAHKYVMLTERHPEFMPEYATGAEVRALPSEDQKLYAEITYSWLLYHIERELQSDKHDSIFCIATQRPYDEQLVLFSAARDGRLSGNTLVSTEEQKEALHYASQRDPATAYNEDGQYLDYYYDIGSVNGNELLLGVTSSTKKIEATINVQTLTLSLLSIGFMIILAIVCLAMILSVIVLPLRKLQKHIRFYKDTKDSKTTLKNLSKINSDNEIGQLAEDIAELTKEIDAYLARIESITSENTRIATELSLASRIQTSMLPDKAYRYPDAKEFNVYGRMYAAKAVGGDFYHHFLIDEDHLCLYIADVSGKGVPAALFMMASSIILRNHINMGKSPAQVLTDMNADICASNPEDMFVTVWLGILDLKTGRLTAANAGHEYPIVKEAGGRFEILKDKHGFMVGGMDGAVYKEYEIDMKPGSAVFVYTDGLTEASDPDNRMFGMDRVLEELNRDTGRKAGEYVRQMKDVVFEFEKGRDPFDDLTMMCLVYWGSEDPPYWNK